MDFAINYLIRKENINPLKLFFFLKREMLKKKKKIILIKNLKISFALFNIISTDSFLERGGVF